MRPKIALIINSSRKLSSRSQLCLELLEKSFETVKFQTAKPKHAISLSQKAVEEGFNHVIAIGGDGTCNEVINGILRTKKI